MKRLQYAYYMGDDDLAYATPGHSEDDEFMTAFFSNQDHDAVRQSISVSS